MGAIVSTGRMVGKLAIEHAPTILTFSAVGGVGMTAWLSARSSIRVQDICLELEYTSDHKPTRKEKIKASWRELIPPVVMGGATIACIIFAHRIHLQRQAAIAAAYSVLSDKYHEYRQEVINEIGDKKENRIQDTIAQNKVNNTYTGLNIIQTRFGNVLFVDAWSGRYFYSSYDAVKTAALTITDIAQRDMCASLNEFYTALEIPQTEHCDLIGWNIAQVSDKSMTPIIPINTDRVVKTPTPEALPAVLVDYEVEPILNFDRMI